jgi:uncharacterized protein YoxC
MTQTDPTIAALQGIERALHTIASRQNTYPTYLLNLIHTEIQKMSAQLDQLTADVAAEKTVVDSAVVLLDGLTQAIKDLAASGGTPEQFAALAADVEAQTQKLSTAVTANTPTPPPPQGAAKRV